MLPHNSGPSNAVRRHRTGTPIGSRNLQPREPVTLPLDDYDATGPDFDPDEWAHARPDRTALLAYLAEPEDDEPTEPPRAVAVKSKSVNHGKARRRAERTGAPPTPTPSAGAASESKGSVTDQENRTAPLGGAADERVPMTPEELRRMVKRDERIMKLLRPSDRERVRGVTDPAALETESAAVVVGYGAGLRLAVEGKADEHAELHHAPPDGPREERQARLREAWEAVKRGRAKIAAYDAWVAANRPGFDDDDLLDGLAGPREDWAAAKARLAELDRKYRTEPAKVKPADLDPAALPLMYRKEFQGKVRAYPGWVAPVLRIVVNRNQAHCVPAMAFVLAQLAYWMRPADAAGRPRAKRAKLIAGKWWIVLGYGTIEKQTPVSLGQARQAVKHLRELDLVETLAAKDAGVGSEAGGVNFGPNTVFLRVRTEVLDPLVERVMLG